jgi:hypothetical protein
MQTLSGSVGADGDNRPGDVRLVRELLNRAKVAHMPVTGKIGDPASDQTVAAILAFQSTYSARPDGRVDKSGQTFKRLIQYAVDFDPKGKTFLQRVEAFVKDAKDRFGVHIIIPASQGGRTAEWAQRAHVAHMIKYNSYRYPDGLKPKHYKAIGGHNLLDFEHLNDPKTSWDGVSWDDFLRNSKGQACRRTTDDKAWAAGFEPDEAQTRKRALAILQEMGVATQDDRPNEPHSAQVAPGYEGCKEPCACGGKRSKHIDGMAIDLSPKIALKTTLPQKFSPAVPASFDKYLKCFGLHRPVMPKESWHVEPILPCP